MSQILEFNTKNTQPAGSDQHVHVTFEFLAEDDNKELCRVDCAMCLKWRVNYERECVVFNAVFPDNVMELYGERMLEELVVLYLYGLATKDAVTRLVQGVIPEGAALEIQVS
jgi:hypothetical protein